MKPAVQWALWSGGMLAGALALGVAGYLAIYQDRVPLGVSALGVELGGLRQPEARAQVAARVAALEGARPALRVEGQEVALPPNAFGEPEALVARVTAAALAGHDAPLGGLAVTLRAARGGTPVQVQVVDAAALREAVAATAPVVDRLAAEPALVMDRSVPGQETVRVQPGRPGRQLDVDRTAADLAAAFTDASRGAPPHAVEATLVAVPPATAVETLEAAAKRANATLWQPATVAAGGRTFTLDRPGQLVERVDLAGAELRLTLDEGAFQAFAEQVANGTRQAPASARLEVRGDQVALLPSSAGRELDPETLRAALLAGLASGARTIDVALPAVPPAVTAEALQPVQAEANRLIAGPVTVTLGERRWTLERAALAKLLALPAEPVPPAALTLDGTRLQAALKGMAAEGAVPPKNARLDVKDGQVQVAPGEDGQALDVDATAAVVQAAVRQEGDARTVAAATKAVPPDVSTAQVEAARAQAEKIAGGPLAVRYDGKTWTLSREELAAMLLFGESAGGVVPYLSRNKLLERVQPIADELNPQLEQAYAAALQAWEERQQARAAAAAGTGEQPGATSPKAADDPKDPRPQRQWVDVPATAAAIWTQSTQPVRTADVRLATDGPSAAGQAGSSALAAARGKWIDVNVTTQSMVAYEGDWPVLTTLVSTGLPRTETPVGTYKIFSKLVADDMRGGSYATGDYYFLPKVPYVMYFLEGGYALHGTYWHNNFGHPMSHGCVNLPTPDSKWLFDWAPMGTTVVVHR